MANREDAMRILVDITELGLPQPAGIASARLGLLEGVLQHLADGEAVDLLQREYCHVSQPLPSLPNGWDHLRVWKTRESLYPVGARGWQPPAERPQAVRLITPLLRPISRAICGVKNRMERKRIMQTAGKKTYDVFLASERPLPPPPQAHLFGVMHDLSPIQRPELFSPEMRKEFAKKVQFFMKHCRTLLAVSEATRQAVIEHLRWPEENIFTVGEGARAAFTPGDRRQSRVHLARRLDIPVGRPMVLCVSTLEPRKNHERLLKAMEIVRAAEPDLRPVLVLAGPDGWQNEAVARKVRLEQKRGNLVRVGYVDLDTLVSLYRGADLLAFVPLLEGFGLPIIEAMACGTPVVTADISSPPEVAGGAARLVDPLDAEAIAEAIQGILTNSQTAAVWSKLGLLRASQVTWSAAGKRALAIFRWAAHGTARPPLADETLASTVPLAPRAVDKERA